MGRKIPGRKHRGVKDPEKQRAEKFAKIKDKINTPPSNPDDQQISKSLSRIIELKKKVKQGDFNKKKTERQNKKEKLFKGRPEKPIPKFERLPGESNRGFSQRVNRICSDVIREAAFENKFQVDIKRNENGEVEGVVKRPKDELELLIKKLKKEKKLKKNKKTKKKLKEKENETRLTKSQKWALKLKERKHRKLLRKDEDASFEPLKDEVKFGEIVHAPPSLIVPKKVKKLDMAPRPGQKELLLKSMLNNGKPSTTSEISIKTKGNNNILVTKATKTIDKKAKRKTLPHALRRQLDKQQKEIIESYKLLKSKKYSLN